MSTRNRNDARRATTTFPEAMKAARDPISALRAVASLKAASRQQAAACYAVILPTVALASASDKSALRTAMKDDGDTKGIAALRIRLNALCVRNPEAAIEALYCAMTNVYASAEWIIKCAEGTTNAADADDASDAADATA